MKIVVEDKVPGLRGVFEPVADVVYLPAPAIDADALRDADALIGRTRPRIDAPLLDGSRLRIVATATIGTDHIDLDYCRRRGIDVVNAPGCNAPAVAQWTLASILAMAGTQALHGKTLGVVGAGHVGKIVADWSRQLGMRVLVADPPRADAEGQAFFVRLEDIAAQADFITFHTPLTSSGPYPTYHLAGTDFFGSLRRRPALLNAARGAVVDTRALIEAVDSGKVSAVAIDCWENEPDISTDLLKRSLIATPHIAGYSLKGKMRASATAIDAVATGLGLKVEKGFVAPPYTPVKIDQASIRSSYDPLADTERLKARPDSFEALRDNYSLRSEVGE